MRRPMPRPLRVVRMQLIEALNGVEPWQKEIDLMLKNGFKLEVEALISKEISYVTEEYVPARLGERNFLD